jgi:hypothetical protein
VLEHVSDAYADRLATTQNRAEFGDIFCEMNASIWHLDPSVPALDEAYLKLAGQVLFDRMRTNSGARRKISDFKRGLVVEARLFARCVGWRQDNRALAGYFAIWFTELSQATRLGRVGNRRGAARTTVRRFVDEGMTAWNEDVTQTGHPEWKDALLEPGTKPDQFSSAPGEPSQGRTVLARAVMAAGLHHGQVFSEKEIKIAIRSRAKDAALVKKLQTPRPTGRPSGPRL